jgi:ribosome modulation factor
MLISDSTMRSAPMDFDAFQEGRDAYLDDRSRESNPFPAGSRRRRLWDDGWVKERDEPARRQPKVAKGSALDRASVADA